MQSFDHFTPNSLDETFALLARFNGQTEVIAGGTDLMLKMRAGNIAPKAIINIKGLPELVGISYDDKSGLRLGALTTLRELVRSKIIQDHYPVLAKAAGLMASEQIRNLATLGGNLCNAAPSADLASPLIALSATAVIVGQQGKREIPLDEFFLSPGKSALESCELLQEIHVPPPKGKTIYLKNAPRAFMDIAVAGAAVHLQQESGKCRQARIVLTAVAPRPLRVKEAEEVLEGHALTEDLITKAAAIAATACSPISDVRGSIWYRRRMIEVLVRRGLTGLSK